jgi:predicted O-methyltransferase YrrM
VSKFTPLTDELYDYMVEHGARQDDVLRRVQEETAAMGDISVMQIAPDQGAFMTLLCRSIGASEAIELGTFTGYSAICIARGLEPGGRLIACELSEEYAETAARNLEAAGVADRVEIRIGPAAETVRAIPEREAFDFAFIDADKPAYDTYYEACLRLVRAGGLIAIDNVLWSGAVADSKAHDTDTAALRALNLKIRDDPRVESCLLTVGDGVMLVRPLPPERR